MVTQRRIEWRPAFDRRHPDPAKNYGIHGVEMRWLVVGPEGAIQFLVFTGWQLPHVVKEFEQKPCSRMFGTCSCGAWSKPMAADLGYHSRVPRYEGQSAIDENCEYIGGPCFYDGSSLNAEQPFELLLSNGEAAVWQFLEGYYADTLAPADEAKA